MNKRTIRLTESRLNRIIRESVRRAINEEYDYDDYDDYEPDTEEQDVYSDWDSDVKRPAQEKMLFPLFYIVSMDIVVDENEENELDYDGKLYEFFVVPDLVGEDDWCFYADGVIADPKTKGFDDLPEETKKMITDKVYDWVWEHNDEVLEEFNSSYHVEWTEKYKGSR